MIFYDDYKKARPKKFNVTLFDIKGRPIKTYNFINDNKETKSFKGNLNNKGAILRFDLLENFGDNYFIIERMFFYVEDTYSFQAN